MLLEKVKMRNEGFMADFEEDAKKKGKKPYLSLRKRARKSDEMQKRREKKR